MPGAAQTMRNLVEDFLVTKTIFFVGDSINGLVYQAAVRALSRCMAESRASDASRAASSCAS
jgi:hypothetical protein